MTGTAQAATASETCDTEEHWDEFRITAQLLEGEASYTLGETWVERQPGHPSTARWGEWRLGWLWGCYEGLNPLMRRADFRWHRYDFRTFGPRVMLVASLNLRIGRWRCYVAAVPGEDHDNEWLAVARRGTKLPQSEAEAMFREFAKRFVWEA